MFKKIAVAIAFSPRLEALIAETVRLCEIHEASMLLIHIGTKTAELESRLNDLLQKFDLDYSKVKIIWDEGKPTKKILQYCKDEKVNLLVAGALKTEGFFQYYMGTVGRKIIRKADCSVLTLIEPMLEPRPFKKVVINGTQLENTPDVIDQGLDWCKKEGSSQVFIVNEIKMYGLQMAAGGEGSEEEVANLRRKLVSEEVAYVENILKTIDKGDLKINIKITSGKWAIELARFAEDIKADLLVVGDEGNLGFFHRIFPHDLEDILANLPCNLLIIKK
ncbi:universal stress protein [Pararhodonellum marinum]|uniref:universal stress protein n=1 Tax=Pararhodonellum marinum TaxID=2755358 RepID=UPI00188E32B0|nr:universal stress protein [Pararhodonellum marinum]